MQRERPSDHHRPHASWASDDRSVRGNIVVLAPIQRSVSSFGGLSVAQSVQSTSLSKSAMTRRMLLRRLPNGGPIHADRRGDALECPYIHHVTLPDIAGTNPGQDAKRAKRCRLALSNGIQPCRSRPYLAKRVRAATRPSRPRPKSASVEPESGTCLSSPQAFRCAAFNHVSPYPLGVF